MRILYIKASDTRTENCSANLENVRRTWEVFDEHGRCSTNMESGWRTWKVVDEHGKCSTNMGSVRRTQFFSVWLNGMICSFLARARRVLYCHLSHAFERYKNFLLWNFLWIVLYSIWSESINYQSDLRNLQNNYIYLVWMTSIKYYEVKIMILYDGQ